MPRDRQKTESGIREAARRILHGEGFEGWGVNAIARAAGIDKVLIYRYFDSLEGLLEEIVQETVFWPDPEGLPDQSAEAFIGATQAALFAHPENHALLTHPSARNRVSLIQRKFSSDLDRWRSGFRRLTRGYITSDDLERLPALLHFQAATGQDTLSARDLWKQVSPPLEWTGPADQASEPDELPPELL